jgi:hypothetical protein
MRPHIVITYDPKGGHGHPDHIETTDSTTEKPNGMTEKTAISGSGRPCSAGSAGGDGTTTRLTDTTDN